MRWEISGVLLTGSEPERGSLSRSWWLVYCCEGGVLRGEVEIWG